MKKQEAINLLNGEGWTKEDAKRALKSIDFKTNKDVDELTIRRVASKFAGSELIQRQRLQAAQKTLVTKKTQEIQKLNSQIKELKQKEAAIITNPDLEEQLQQLIKENQDLAKVNAILEQDNQDFQNITAPDLEKKLEKLLEQNQELTEANTVLKKDNKDLKNIVDAIRLKLTIETKHLLQLENSEIKKGLVKLLKSTLG